MEQHTELNIFEVKLYRLTLTFIQWFTQITKKQMEHSTKILVNILVTRRTTPNENTHHTNCKKTNILHL